MASYLYKYLKGQCVGIKAMQSHVISHPMKLLLDALLQEFVEFIISICMKLERPSKYSEG